jgi:hypothetical protein
MGIFIYGWHSLKERWETTAALCLVCAILQLVSAAAIAFKKERLGRWCSILTLTAVAVIAGQYYGAAEHLMEAYGSDAKRIGQASRESLLLALPWATFFPLWHALSGGVRSLVGPLIALLISMNFAKAVDDPLQQWPAQPEQEAAAEAAFLLWTGQRAEVPIGASPATVLLTPFSSGKAGRTVRGDGANLRSAISDALEKVRPPKTEHDALVLDVARVRYAKNTHVPAGDGGGLRKKGGRSPSTSWRPGRMGSKRVAPNWTLPRPKMKGDQPTRFDSVVSSRQGTFLMRGSWTSPATLTAETALEAALNSGKMLARHQKADGRYAYTVKGPSGKIDGSSYNFPRHAGTTWFLARLAKRTNDPEIWAATRRGLDYMAQNTTHMADGRAYLGDPRRRDGKAWVGTTALAVLAAVVANHELAAPWGRFIASSVDDVGQVRGEMKRSDGVHRAQNKNPYGQGQTALAIAALVRAKHEEFRPVLNRVAEYFDGDYAPGGAGRLFVLDEHWTCLASLAIQDVLDRAFGSEVCRAYLEKERYKTPDSNSRIRPSAGAAGGLAEAVVAGAYLFDDYRDDALAYGQWFLQNAYQPQDAVFLPKPSALIGGFRDNPYKLDVRMDAVQHIGSALLGVEALLSDVRPGSLP